MKRIVFVCDRCGAEIDGAAGQISIWQNGQNGENSPADTGELAALFEGPSEREVVEAALDPGWDLCAECVEAVLRTLIQREKPRATVKGPLPDTTKRRGGRPKKKTEEG